MIIKNYLSLIKFSHTVFALPFAIVGFLVAISEQPVINFPIVTLLLIVICMITARSAAMAFNRYIDAKFDKLNNRTANREIPAGIIKPINALVFTICCCVVFIVSTYFINRYCFYLSPVALSIVLGYSLTKRFTWLCHFILGLGLSLAPIGAYLAVNQHFAIIPVCYSLVVLCWVAGFDIIYALQDEEFDKANNLFSIPVLLGTKKAMLLSSFIHVLAAVFLLLGIALLQKESLFLYMGATVFITLLCYQHLIISPTNLSRINLSFFTLNGLASIIFALFFITNYFYYKF
jgi:4-hydroxybenzoate polyprenyltransferase